MSDGDQIEKALAEWATASLHKNVRISKLRRLSGGASQETWSFEADSGGARRGLILRRAPGGVTRATGSNAVGLITESRIIDAARIAKVPVPEVLGVSRPGSALGEAFIMARVEGETIARKILRDPEFGYARSLLTAQCATALARIHSIPIDQLPELPVSSGMGQIQNYETIYRNFKQPRPVFEIALQWLKANAPAPCDNVLVHGDFRLGNLIVSQAGLAAVLDWEIAHFGDPREDIAWICVNAWRFGQSDKRVGGFGQLEYFLETYTKSGGAKFSAKEIDWWEILGSLKWGIMCMIMYHAWKSGSDASVERAAIGRRVSENEIDLINLFERVM